MKCQDRCRKAQPVDAREVKKVLKFRFRAGARSVAAGPCGLRVGVCPRHVADSREGGGDEAKVAVLVQKVAALAGQAKRSGGVVEAKLGVGAVPVEERVLEGACLLAGDAAKVFEEVEGWDLGVVDR